MIRLPPVLLSLSMFALAGCASVAPATPPATGGSSPAAGAGTPATAVPMARSLERRQCEQGGKTLAQLQSDLRAAGVRVLGSTCGNDGRMYPAVCGGPDGSLGVIDVPAEQVPLAESHGFVRLSTLPDAMRNTCP